MSAKNPRGIIELGNIKIKCIIFRIDENNNSEILSTSIISSEGFHNGVIVNFAKATKAIRSCIASAEKNAKVSIKKINVLIEQPEFICTKFSKYKKIDGSKIEKEDINFLLREGKKQVTHNDENQSIIHIFNHNYIVDGKTFLEEPIDVYANLLSHEMTFITMPKNNLKNIKKAFIDCDVEVERFISCTFALAAKLINNEELQVGSILIDIGYEKTSLGLFKNLALIHSMTFPIGVNHIVKDLSKICSLNLEESKFINSKIDYSFQNNQEIFDKDGYLKEIYFKDSGYRKISKTLVLNVIKARLEEICEIIQKQIIVAGFKNIAGINFFIVGGGSNLFNLERYFSEFFKYDIKKLNKTTETKDEEKSYINFLGCLGALKIIKDGWETEAIAEFSNKNAQKLGFFAKFFGKEL